ncbi:MULTISPECIES: response regulator transcription factor [Rhizobium/Agrobacterium group]|uniref:Response regulator transcription factor n=2 Tax=Rhizobium/Agrobacterium group TaxID=227290 RepID=A0A546XLV9_RHIRH|nr:MULTISPECIES: response regulator transcription factor [Rhizobium/Agrobacterium group]MCZ7466220.1 response regulator transcription factor [Rhizobium rhizogenes]MCZ7472124.1 response regulator transcription factor [Rhizobium rhizogenes]MCZ7480012.1 response regulator transcription factor [Rhizobium rhizogenes]MDA5634365.1 response regulator transcription factor [Agrobacterium sp. ST15.16.024]MDF1891205.1 response regulator transcription factor [Rhizobium rhizogenes]
MRLLVVEDDDVLLDGLRVGLQLAGFTVDAVMTLGDAKIALENCRFDAVVLDVMLPDGSGLDLLRHTRNERNRVPILLLTAKDATTDKICGLDAGADDYLGKPFDLDEVAARLRAIIRRGEGRSEGTLSALGVTLDPAKMVAKKDDNVIALSRREFAIIHALMQNPGMIFSKPVLEEKLYGWQEDVESNTIEVHIHKLRSKLGAGFIETVRGVGYRVGRVA